MAFKTVRAHPEIIRRLGLGAQQCQDCGAVYKDTAIPKSCENGECPTNRPSGHPTEYLSEGYRQGYEAALKEIIAGNAAAPKRYHLTEAQGRTVKEHLLHLARWLEHEGGSARDIRNLIKLFE